MRLKIFILYFILLRVGLSYSQYVDFYNQLKIYHYIHNYSPVYIKNNKVKSMEINENDWIAIRITEKNNLTISLLFHSLFHCSV